MPFTMIKRSMVAAGAGLLGAALFAKRAARDQRAADAWNQTRLARGFAVGGHRVMLRAPQKVGGRGPRGRWHWHAEGSRHPRRTWVKRPLRRSS